MHIGFYITLIYRIKCLRKNGHIVFKILAPLDIFFSILFKLFFKVSLPSSCIIDGGLYLPHPDGIIINSDIKIGKNCSIYQQVTIGEWKNKKPIIEDNVIIFGGAKVFGGVKIAKNSIIGANVVINFDVSENTIVAIDKKSFKLYQKMN